MTALIFIIRALFSLAVTAFLLRVLLPLCRADARNPLSQAVIRLTNPLVLPLRRVLPPIKRLDTGSLVALLIVQLLATALVWLLSGLGLRAPLALALSAAHDLASLCLQFYFVAILIYALLSWVAPGTYSPTASLLTSLCMPIIRPFQRLIPPLGGIDLSALFALIAIQALQLLLNP
jgi:YggT family protein